MPIGKLTREQNAAAATAQFKSGVERPSSNSSVDEHMHDKKRLTAETPNAPTPRTNSSLQASNTTLPVPEIQQLSTTRVNTNATLARRLEKQLELRQQKTRLIASLEQKKKGTNKEHAESKRGAAQKVTVVQSSRKLRFLKLPAKD